MQSRDNHWSVIAVYWTALGFILGYTFIKLLENPTQPTVITDKHAEQICQVEMQWGRAESHVYTGKLSTPHLKQQAK